MKTAGTVIICNPPPVLAKYLCCAPIASIEVPYIGEYWEVQGGLDNPPEINDERMPHPTEPILVNLKDGTGFYLLPPSDEVSFIWDALEDAILMEPAEIIHYEVKHDPD